MYGMYLCLKEHRVAREGGNKHDLLLGPCMYMYVNNCCSFIIRARNLVLIVLH